jgi:hypothetical protein
MGNYIISSVQIYVAQPILTIATRPVSETALQHRTRNDNNNKKKKRTIPINHNIVLMKPVKVTRVTAIN